MERGTKALVLLLQTPQHDFALPPGRRLFTENPLGDAHKGWGDAVVPVPWEPLGTPAGETQVGVWSRH